MNSLFHPTLLIGAGGTGVRIVRYFRALAAMDPELAALLDGPIQTVGIDTDPNTNRHVEAIPANLTQLYSETRVTEPLPAELPVLSNYILCNHNTLKNAVAQLAHQQAATDEADTLSEQDSGRILSWFPCDENRGGISANQVTESAQFRPLGRLAFFKNQTVISDILHKAYHEAENALIDQAILNVYIICSTGGGTGSGMIWDLAFLLKSLGSNLQVNGIFMLPEAHDAQSNNERLFANSYAVLKELTHLKNWSRPFPPPLAISRDGMSGKTHEPSVIDQVYLFGAFAPGRGVADRSRATLDISCLRIAQNIRALQHQSVRATLPRTMDRDVLATQTSRARQRVFGTACFAALDAFPPNTLLEPFMGELFHEIRDGLTDKDKHALLDRLPRKRLPLGTDLADFCVLAQQAKWSAKTLAAELHRHLTDSMKHQDRQDHTEIIPAYETLIDLFKSFLDGLLEGNPDQVLSLHTQWLCGLSTRTDFNNLTIDTLRAQLMCLEQTAGRALPWWLALCRAQSIQSRTQISLTEYFYRTKSPVFVDGVSENQTNLRRLAVFTNQEHTSQKSRVALREQVQWLTQTAFSYQPQMVSDKVATPMVHYLDLCRESEEIEKIGHYHQSYHHEPASHRARFHVHPSMVDFPEIVTTFVNEHQSCGNPGCQFNLKNTPRSFRFCPGCKDPIYNRCGNMDCHATDVLAQIERGWAAQPEEGHDKRMPHNCPGCGQWLKTYWWKCPYHSEPNPIDKITCKSCMDEFQRNIRKMDDVIRRIDQQTQVCHGCQRIETQEAHKITLPKALVPAYKRGVNGHQTRTFRVEAEQFRASLGGLQSAEHMCPNGHQRHYLFPTCPIGRDYAHLRHHLYQSASGQFCCTRHPELRFHVCYNCAHPVLADGSEPQCPRCLFQLAKCFYCSETHGFQYPTGKQGSLDRCPYCTNLLKPLLQPGLHSNKDGLSRPTFCPNIYACPAGAGLWHTAAEFSDEPCRACPDPPALLLPLARLDHIMATCPLCTLVLSPEPFHRMDPPSLASVLKRTQDLEGQVRDESCLICSNKPADLLPWMTKEKNATLFFEDAVSILKALYLHREFEAGYRALMGKQRPSIWKAFEDGLETLIEIFPTKSRLQQTMAKRIYGLINLHQQYRTHNRHWHTPNTPDQIF